MERTRGGMGTLERSSSEKKDLLVKLMCFQHAAFIISVSVLMYSHKQLTLFLWLFYSQFETSSFSREVEARRYVRIELHSSGSSQEEVMRGSNKITIYAPYLDENSWNKIKSQRQRSVTRRKSQT